MAADDTKYYIHDAHKHITWDLSPKSYSDPMTAAIEGLKEANLGDPKVEYGGVVVEIPGHFYTYTVPVTDNQKDKVQIPQDYMKGGRLYVDDFPVVARFHTHPCLKDYASDEFSAVDIALDDAFNADGYVLSLCTGNIYLHRVKEIGSDLWYPFTWKGHVVGNLKVDGHRY